MQLLSCNSVFLMLESWIISCSDKVIYRSNMWYACNLIVSRITNETLEKIANSAVLIIT